MDEILVHQLANRPCDFVEIMLRIDEHLRCVKAKGATVLNRAYYILLCTNAPMRSMAARASGRTRAQTCQVCGIRGHISSST